MQALPLQTEMGASADRPWGSFATPAFLRQTGSLKLLRVAPRGRLSLQRHENRAEHWIVLSGRGDAHVGDAHFSLTRGDHCHVPAGAWHRLCNPSPDDELLVAEVQVGAYDSSGEAEADIERQADDYGRVSPR